MKNLYKKINLFANHFRRQHNLQSLSYSGCLDEIYRYFIRILDNNAPLLKKFNTLKIHVSEDWTHSKLDLKTYPVYEKVTDFEFKSRGQLPFLYHFAENINHFINLQSLAIRLQDIDLDTRLAPLQAIFNLPKLKLYCLYITRMTPKHLLDMYMSY